MALLLTKIIPYAINVIYQSTFLFLLNWKYWEVLL